MVLDNALNRISHRVVDRHGALTKILAKALHWVLDRVLHRILVRVYIDFG